MKVIGMLFALAIAVVLTGCTSSDDAAVASYQGAGSKWTATFTGGAFTINYFTNADDASPAMTVLGTYVDYSNGFRKLTVSSSSGAGGPAAGDLAYGFEVPGYAFFLKPMDSGDSEPIVMIQAGVCPTTSFDANWIIAKFSPASLAGNGGELDNTNDAFGSAAFVFNGTSSNAHIEQLGAVLGNNIGDNDMPFDSADCSGGFMLFDDGFGNDVSMFFTTSGGAIVHTNDQIIFASPKASAAVTQADLVGTYSALVFNENGSVGEKLFPAKLTIPAAGNSTGFEITDVETDATDVSGIEISGIAANAESPGLFNAAVDPVGAPGTTNGRLNCAYIPFGAYKIVACNGYMEAGNEEPFFFLGRSR